MPCQDLEEKKKDLTKVVPTDISIKNISIRVKHVHQCTASPDLLGTQTEHTIEWEIPSSTNCWRPPLSPDKSSCFLRISAGIPEQELHSLCDSSGFCLHLIRREFHPRHLRNHPTSFSYQRDGGTRQKRF